MDDAVRNTLLGSIAGNRLTLLVGAGLSMSAPSNLPPARVVAQVCYDAFVARVDELPPEIRDDLEAVAEAIAQKVDFRNVFIRAIVPWDKLVGPPNDGHFAIADLLLSGGAQACLSANYDNLIEQAGAAYGADLQSALFGDEATELAATQSPLLKFHGCMIKDRDHTVWTKEQFAQDVILTARRASNVDWMKANLRRKDILIVGFWSDWSYLNDVFEAAFDDVLPLSITIVDPETAENLAAKAPALWALANQEHVRFNHVPLRSHVFLGELQNEIGKKFFRQLLQLGAAAFGNQRPQDDLPAEVTAPPALDNTAYYAWRRDAAGLTDRQPVRSVLPEPTSEMTGYAHILLRRAGGVVQPNGYDVGGVSVRVVNGAGRALPDVQRVFAAGPAVDEADVVICAGATDFGVPGNIIRAGQAATTVRDGVEGRWLTLPDAVVELQL